MYLPDLGTAVERRHISVLILLDAFYGDVDDGISVSVVLVSTATSFEPLLVAIRLFRVSSHRTPLASCVRG